MALGPRCPPRAVRAANRRTGPLLGRFRPRTRIGSGPMPAEQFKHWLVCQYCGRVTTKDDAAHWLDQPHRNRWDVRVVRCPQHWSEWALRHTREGRSKENRERMAVALDQPEPDIEPALQPFPKVDRDDPDVNDVRI